MATNKHHHKKKIEGPLEKILVGYTIEGHSTWRFEVKATLKEFEESWNAFPHPKITQVRTWKIDRVAGTVSE